MPIDMKSTCVSYGRFVVYIPPQTDVNNFRMVSRCASCLEIITCIALMCYRTHAAIQERQCVVGLSILQHAAQRTQF